MNDGAADHLKPGTALPRIGLPATDGRIVCVADLTNRSVLFVYPWTGRPGLPNPPGWDDIPGAHGSTPEIEGFRDAADQYARLGVNLFGLSGQSCDYQREMVTRLKVPFAILSDADWRFAAALRLSSFAAGSTNYLKRLTLVVKAGCIEHCFYPVREPGRHASEIMDWLRQSEPA